MLAKKTGKFQSIDDIFEKITKNLSFKISMVDIVSTHVVAQNIGDILMINPKIQTLLQHARHNNVVY